MGAWGFNAQFVPRLLDGTKPHTIRADRKDGRVPKVGETFSAYYGMRTKQCTWLFDSVVTKVQPIVIKRGVFPFAYYPQVKIGKRWLAPTQVLALAHADGFKYAKDFREHFVPNKDDRFTGLLINWDPAKANACRHSCRECGLRLKWSPIAKAWFCFCGGETVHHLKRPTK